MAATERTYYVTDPQIGGYPRPIPGFDRVFNEDGRPVEVLGRQLGEAVRDDIRNLDAIDVPRGIANLLGFFEDVHPPYTAPEAIALEAAFFEGAGLEREA